MNKHAHTVMATITLLASPLALLAEHSIDWYTVDGGGASAGNSISISGTIGQPVSGLKMQSALLLGITAVAMAAAPLFATPIGSAFSYQGKLDTAGAPYTGQADFIFTLHEGALATSNVVDVPISKNNVSVENGILKVNLDWPMVAFDGDARWLQISVRTPHDPTDTAAYEDLSPLQKITATPYASQTRGMYVDDQLRVGMGTTAPMHELHITSNSPELYLESTTSDATGNGACSNG
ncbi:MAG: hypothetical protein ACYTHJ_00570 [Planctomycetota bacterium]|jgi:hypothetical protein